ncbi:MAG: exodeoxyribonuclease VII large subunit [Bacillota bacterium]
MRLKTLSVSELNRYIHRILTSDPILNHINLAGEVSNFKQHSSGHCYFSLKDEKSKINCVLFRDNYMKVKFDISEGLHVIVKGYVSTFERDGQVQFYVREIEPEGMGALYLAFEQLKSKLEKEGLFDIHQKKNLPFLPPKIAVVTSPTGAAVRDILSVIKRRNPYVSIVVYPVLVQGEMASSQISKAIEDINQRNDIALMIVGRGGGSIEELWAFNEEKVARSIFQSKIPVISAVGHETDFTIADFVADMRAATPSAAAELAVPRLVDILSAMNGFKNQMDRAMNHYLVQKYEKLSYIGAHRLLKPIQNRVQGEKQYLDRLKRDHDLFLNRILEKNKFQLLHHGEKLYALNPFQTLQRGYSIIHNADTKQTIYSVEQVKTGDHMELILSDGIIHGTVVGHKKEERALDKFKYKG